MLHDGDPRTLESLLGLSAESVHPENVSNAATVDRLVDSLPQSLVEARGGVSGGLPPPPPPPPQQVAISSASPQPAQTPILLTASHVLDGQQGLTFTVAPHGVHQHHLVTSGGAVASNAGHAAPAGTQFVAFQSPLGFAPAGFVAIGGGGPAGGGAGGSPAAPVPPSSPSPVQSPYHLQTHSPLATHASSLPRSSPAPPPLTPSPSPSPSSTSIPSVAQGVGSASNPSSAPTTLHHLRPNTPIQVQLPASAFPLLQILQQGGTSGGGVSGSPFRTNAGPGPPQQHLHPQPPPLPPRPKQPQLLPKPASGAPPPVSNSSIAVSSSSSCIASPAVQSVVSTVASSGQATVGPHGAQLVIGQNHPHHHHSPAGTLVLNQMIPGLSQSPVIIQQPGGGVQFILRQQQQQQPLVGGTGAGSASTGGVLGPGVVGGPKGVGGGLVLAGAPGQVLIHHPQHQQLQQQSQGRPLGGTAGPGMAVQAGATGGQVVRFIATTQGPMQLQQIQTPSGPTLIAVPPGQTLSFQQIRGAAAGSGSVVPSAMLQGHAQIIQGTTVGPTAQTIQTHLMQQQQQQSLVHGGLANQGRTSGPPATMLPNHSAVNVVDSVGVVARTRTMGTGMNPMSVISPPSLSFPPPQPRKKPKKKKKRKGSRDDEEDGEGSTEVEESGEEMCGGMPGKTLNLADIMKSAGIGDDEDMGPFESGVADGGEEGSLVQGPQIVPQTNAIQQQSNGGGAVGSSPDICTNSCIPSQADGLEQHPGLNTNHQQHSSPQQSHLLAQLQGSLAVQQGQGQVRFALSEDGRVLFQRDCTTAGQSLSSQTQPSVVNSITPPIQSQSQTILLHQQSISAPRAHIAPPAPQPVSQLLSTSANTPSGNVMGGGVGGGSTSGGSPSTGSPAPNNHVVLSQLLSHGGCVTNMTGETALPTLPVGTQLGVGTPTNQNLRNQQHCNQQPVSQMSHPESHMNSSMQLPPSPQYQKPITQNMHQQQPLQVHQPSPQPPQQKHSPPLAEQPQPQTSHQNQPNSPPSPSYQEHQNNQSNSTVNIGGLVLTQQQQALLHQIKMSDLVAAGAASGLGAKSLTEALIQALSAVASNISMGSSPSSSSDSQQKGNSKFSRPGGKCSPPGPPTSTQLLLQQLGAAVAAAARKVIPAGAVVEPGMAQDVRRPSPPVARKRRKKASDVGSPTTLSGPRLQGGGHVQNDVARAASRLCHTPNSPRAATPVTGISQPMNSFSSPVPSSLTESKLSSPIVPAVTSIPDNSSQNSNSCDPGMSQELRLNQMNTQVPLCQQSPPHLVPISSSASSSPSTTTSSATTTSSLTSDSSKVQPVSSSSGMVMSGQSPVIPRVQTIQLTAQKQQQLREVQSQLQALTSRKGQRTAQENLAIQHLYLQQQRILLTGKIVPTIPGQHAQGVQFSPLSPSSPSSDQLMAGNSSGGGKGGKAPSTCLANLLRQPVSSSQSPTIRYYHQVGNQIIPLAPQQAATAQGGGLRSTEARPSKSNGGNLMSMEDQTMGSSCAKSPSKMPVPSSVPQSSICMSSTSQMSNADSSPAMHSSPTTSTAQNSNPQGIEASGEDTGSQPMDSSVDASSPRNGVKRPALSPVRPSINKVSLIEQQLRTDQAGALNPDVHSPFSGRADACKRLVRYHVLNERVLSARDLDKADEIFEATARHLLDKFSQMTAKYRYLLLMESMKEVRTSELMMIDRMFVAEEQLALERLKEEARLAEEMEAKKGEEEPKSEEDANGSVDTTANPSGSSTPGSNETSLKEVRINLHDVLKSEAIKKEPEEGRYTIVRNTASVVKEEEVKGEEEKPYDEWEAIQKELSVYCGVKREDAAGREQHPPNGEPGARLLPAVEESSCDASRSPGLGGPAPPLDDPGGGAIGENSNLCEDDDINAQVQSAIDSILNLQRAEDEGLGLEDVFDVTLEEEDEEEERRTVETGGNREGISRGACEETDTLSKEEVGGGDLALDEAVRSILSS